MATALLLATAAVPTRNAIVTRSGSSSPVARLIRIFFSMSLSFVGCRQTRVAVFLRAGDRLWIGAHDDGVGDRRYLVDRQPGSRGVLADRLGARCLVDADRA